MGRRERSALAAFFRGAGGAVESYTQAQKEKKTCFLRAIMSGDYKVEEARILCGYTGKGGEQAEAITSAIQRKETQKRIVEGEKEGAKYTELPVETVEGLDVPYDVSQAIFGQEKPTVPVKREDVRLAESLERLKLAKRPKEPEEEKPPKGLTEATEQLFKGRETRRTELRKHETEFWGAFAKANDKDDPKFTSPVTLRNFCLNIDRVFPKICA